MEDGEQGGSHILATVGTSLTRTGLDIVGEPIMHWAGERRRSEYSGSKEIDDLGDSQSS